MKKSILVTGGAGYIGSAAVKLLVSKGYRVVGVDNLSKGIRKLVDKKASFYKLDLSEKDSLDIVFKKHKIDAVMHFAAYKAVGESMANAVKYSDNITGTVNLLNAMVKYKVGKIIYSSSAAVYSEQNSGIVKEEKATGPASYYGFTKLLGEQLIEWYSKIHGIKYISFRYFNVAGDAGLNYIDPAPENVMPALMESITSKRKFVIFGSDYPTRDGTCIRDYIDINDLVNAHVLALKSDENVVLNLGTSKGITVKELVQQAIDVTGKRFPYSVGRRRKGDVPMLVASYKKANKILGWKPTIDTRGMIHSTYRVYTK